MGVFSSYCAICSGPATECSIGSTVPEALEWRRKRVARKRTLMLETGQYPSRYSGTDIWGNADLEDEYEEQKGGWTKSDEDCSYDPDLVSEESLEWLLTVHCLGRVEEGFISGPGTEIDRMLRICVDIGDDPNQPQDRTTYFTYIGGDYPAFPFHWECFSVLMWALGHDESNNIDRTVLYEVMKDIAPTYSLDVDYGNIGGPEQDWISMSGEEYVVTNPIDDMGDLIRELTTRDAFKHSNNNSNIQNHVINDPFDKIPFDILYNITSYLPGNSILALSIASWSVTNATRYGGIWKQLFAREMEWLWELQELFDADDEDSPLPPDLSLKRLYIYLDKKTTPTYAMDAGFLCLANRRRIWRPCQQLAELYFEKLRQNSASNAAEVKE
ncbi:hypothetical protein AJ78_03194 [Emergomyces pasteurianus Ep9510]|uniref:F-box domain-containing protein n=1 Tax=Emergomyces pasteurianus Ep9510 TaxID=1447872 RepID=A0A1J9PL92_9EURO|nr:hypothetical protein AJ78_03194 [Emergomyces pasteurianus Ep9510]